MVRPETICGFGMANDSSIIHAALQKYMEKKIKNVEDSITNKLVLRLPFESESKCSNLLLGHVNGIVCPMAQPPKIKTLCTPVGLFNSPLKRNHPIFIARRRPLSNILPLPCRSAVLESEGMSRGRPTIKTKEYHKTEHKIEIFIIQYFIFISHISPNSIHMYLAAFLPPILSKTFK